MGTFNNSEPGKPTYKIGDRIGGRYEIYRILGGEGKTGMGIVYVCLDHENNNVLALKTFQDKFLSSKKMRSNFKREALAWIHLERHPCIVKADWVQDLDYRLFVASQFIAPDEQGRNTLGHYLKITISPKQALTWSIQFCHGMEHAYSKGVTPHRDIKPDNIMITKDGILKITDFGLAGLWDDSDVSAEGEPELITGQKGLTFIRNEKGRITGGTLPWMAPEQFNGEADVSSDIYSYGIVMYQMVNGSELPFHPLPGEKWTSAEWKTAHKTYVLPETDSVLSSVIEKCLSKSSMDRYKDFGELRQDLEELYREITNGDAAPSLPDVQKFKEWERVCKGASLAYLGLTDESIKEYEEVIRINPDYAEAHNNLGNALSRKGHLDEAIKAYQRAIRIKPDYAEAKTNLGSVLADKGHLDEAIKEFQMAIEINPEFALAHTNLGTVLSDKGYLEEAIKEYQEAIRINPEYAAAHYNLGNALYANGQLDEAIKEYQESTRINPEFALAHTNLGAALKAKGHLEEAIKEFQEAIRINPQFALAHYNLGIALCMKGLFGEAIESFEYFIKCTPLQYAEQVGKVKDLIKHLKEQI